MPQIYASIDLGGTKIAGAFATADGTLLARQTIPTESHLGPEGVLDRIAELVQTLRAQTGQPPQALGLGVPGLVDLRAGRVKFLPNLPTNWPDVPARARLEPQIGCPVYLLNDVRMATLAELTYGHGRSVDNFAFFALGTGIGGGLVLEGKLRLGPLGAAGEVGHQTILPHGPRCGCGSTGCLEALASGPAITAVGVRLLLSGQTAALYELVAGDPGRVTPREMVEAAEAGDESVRAALRQAAEYIGIGVANVVSILHPQLIVLGGSVAEIGPLLYETVRATISARVGMFPTDDVRVEPSQLGPEAGLLGGIALAVNHGLVEQDRDGGDLGLGGFFEIDADNPPSPQSPRKAFSQRRRLWNLPTATSPK